MAVSPPADPTAAPTAAPRPWHVSPVHARAFDRPRDRRDRTPTTDGSSSPAAAPIVVLPPLWYRIVTGQVVWWRIRRMLNRMLWWRRHTARRALRWSDRHPEIEQGLEREGVVRLVAAQLSARRRHLSRMDLRYRPLVTVDAGLDITRLRDQPLVDAVEIVVDGTADATHILSGNSSYVEITPAVTAGLATGNADTTPVRLLSAIDIRTWNPKWFRPAPITEAVTLRQLTDGDGSRFTRPSVENAHRAAAVMCDDHGSATAVATARTIAELAATGAPLAGKVGDEVAHLLGAPLTAAIGAVDARTLYGATARERHSVLLRRLAQHDFSPRGTWRRIGAATGASVSAEPAVSVLLPSNRADDVIEAARQAATQRDVRVQLIVGLHGTHMSHDLDEQLADAFPGDLVVRHLPDEMNLGQVLNVLTDAADGELVSKWDDDDWYDRWHLNDLVAALEYSGAAMVAKAAEFVYLEAIDLTIRRFSTGSERPSTTVAGGTLLLTRRDLERVRWAEAPRRVDRLLIDALEATGRLTYRTHGLGYVLRRRGGALGQHTWQAGDSYFLSQSQDQRRGLDLAFAGFDEADA
jgi:hypothetical protein